MPFRDVKCFGFVGLSVMMCVSSSFRVIFTFSSYYILASVRPMLLAIHMQRHWSDHSMRKGRRTEELGGKTMMELLAMIIDRSSLNSSFSLSARRIRLVAAIADVI